MKRFAHHTALSMREAERLLKGYEGKARVNAGGTDLLGAMRDRITDDYPEAVIDLKGIEGLDYIKKDKTGLKIGALAKLRDLAKSQTVKEEYPLIAEAAHSVASPQVRNMATIGGNLAQEVRCWYYRYPRQIGGPIVCLRKGGKICSALAGDNRYHSIFGAAALEENPCASHCPAHADIPGYLDRVRKGDLKAAARMLMEYNPIPAITGRVCPVFCEPECNRREFDDAVAIHCIERGVGDYALERAGDFFLPPAKETGKRVAVVGSGPAGLAAAFYLRRNGHGVTLYERLPEAGGMLRFSIPPFRLPKDVVRKQIQALEGMGIRFEVGVDVGTDPSLADLRLRFDAIVVAAGTWRSLKLGVAGVDSEGVLYALEYLKKINSGEKPALGKRVIVIGGGSVAVDAARCARRLGADEVHLVCLECRDLTSKDRMLALDSEILEAEEEGIIIHGSLGIKEILTKNGKAVGLETMACLSVRETDGSFNPQYDTTCTALSLAAESIIIAIGQAAGPGLSALEESEPLFVGGDMVSGPSTVIEAVASGRAAALRVDRSFGAKEPSKATQGAEWDFADPSFEEIPRLRLEELPPLQRLLSIEKEDMPSPGEDQIAMEAKRCFNCGCLAVGPSDIAVALVALDARIITTKRSLPAQVFFRASATSSTVLERDELIKEVRIPKPPFGSRQRYDKFTLRKPIDFGIVSVASMLTIEDNICKDARLVLGAVAPEPLRARNAEEILKGRTIDEKIAKEAGEAAAAGALPLAMNDYKVEITKVLVKRAVLGSSCVGFGPSTCSYPDGRNRKT